MPRSARWGGIGAVLGGILWAILTPLMATIGLCQGRCLLWQEQPLVIRMFGPWLASEGMLTWASGEDLYFAYGRFFFLVYLGIMAGVMGIHAVAREGQYHNFARRRYQFLLSALGIAALGDFFSYGVGVISELSWQLGFGVEVLSWLGVVSGSVAYGLALLRARSVPPWMAIVVILGGMLMLGMFFDRSIIMYMPNAQTLPLALAWIILGTRLIIHPTAVHYAQTDHRIHER